MRKIESLNLRYIGYEKPENLAEAELEILGLETAIAAAKQRIAVLQQSLKLQSLIQNSVVEDKNAQTVTETASTEKAK